MDLGSVLLILSVAILAGLLVARPFFDRHALGEPGPNQERSALLAERERVLDALQELDFDQVLGKIAAEDYPAQRAVLLQQGTEVLKKLDAVEAETPDAAISDVVEQAIADRRAAVNGGPRQPVAADDEIERLIASRRRDLAGRPAGFCHQCGQAVHQADKFCSKCGASLA